MKIYRYRKSLIIAGALLAFVLFGLAFGNFRIETKLVEGLCAVVMLGVVIYALSARFELDDEKLTYKAIGVLKQFSFDEISSVRRIEEDGKRPLLEIKTEKETLLIQWYIERYLELMEEIQKRTPHA